MAVLSCTMPGQGSSVDCGQDLLVHYAPHLLEMLSDTSTCLCSKAVVILPDFRVEAVSLAHSLLEDAAGKEVMLDYRVPAARRLRPRRAHRRLQ